MWRLIEKYLFDVVSGSVLYLQIDFAYVFANDAYACHHAAGTEPYGEDK